MEALLAVLRINDTIVYMAYGLVFFSLGLVVALHSRRHSQLDLAKHLVWLAAFGLCHGMYEWARIFIPIQATYLPEDSTGLLIALSTVLLAVSFFLLGQFGCLLALPEGRARLVARATFAAVLLAWLVGSLLMTGLVDGRVFPAAAWARRLLGLPASTVAAIGMFREARGVASSGLRNIARDFRIAGASFGAYALVAGLVVSPAQDQLASPWPLLGPVLELFGVPAPVLRSLAGLGMAFGIVRGLRIFEIETGRMLEAFRREAARAHLLKQVITAQEEERRRIARELHDETGQSLTAVIMALGAAGELLDGRSKRASTMVNDARQIAAQALESTRELILGLRPAALDDLGLVPALRRFAEDLSRKHDISIRVEASQLNQRLPSDVEVVLFRILQEGLHNVVRHSSAHTANVRLDCDDGRVWAEVADDGTGFSLAEATSRPESGRGLGLLGMAERAGLLGGTVNVITSPGKGTRIVASIPLTEVTERTA